ncbi:MAG: hypothetical protein SOW45_06670 [Prevotella sp.]|nr:hypothetical protein [Prevotella sp.]
MESKKVRRQFHSGDFILKIFRDNYSSEKSKYFISHKHDIDTATFLRWQRKDDLAGKEFSLHRGIINKVKSDSSVLSVSLCEKNN